LEGDVTLELDPVSIPTREALINLEQAVCSSGKGQTRNGSQQLPKKAIVDHRPTDPEPQEWDENEKETTDPH
jgi:hypothetical protein